MTATVIGAIVGAILFAVIAVIVLWPLNQLLYPSQHMGGRPVPTTWPFIILLAIISGAAGGAVGAVVGSLIS